MTDLISKEVFRQGMKRLEAAFMKEVPKETLKLYYEKLNPTTDNKFKDAVEFIIEDERFFPSIKVFKEWLPTPTAKQESIEELCS